MLPCTISPVKGKQPLAWAPWFPGGDGRRVRLVGRGSRRYKGMLGKVRPANGWITPGAGEEMWLYRPTVYNRDVQRLTAAWGAFIFDMAMCIINEMIGR